MIPYSEFGRLRLTHFVVGEDVDECDDLEYEEQLWTGEYLGFSEWLRLEADPHVLRCLSLDFSDFPAEATKKVLETVGLAVWPGMNLDELINLFSETVYTVAIIPDRKTYEFSTADREPYQVSCTVLDDGGLTHLTIMTQLPGSAA